MLQVERVGERQQLEQTRELDRLVDLRHLFDDLHDGDLVDGRDVLRQVLAGLDVLQRRLDALGQAQRIEVGLQVVEQVLQFGAGAGDDVELGLETPTSNSVI